MAGIESQGHVVEVKGSNKGSESPMESRRPGGGGVNSSRRLHRSAMASFGYCGGETRGFEGAGTSVET